MLRFPPTFAVLGVARITPKALLRPSQGLCEVRGIASRSPERAAEFAREHSLGRAYGSYLDALEDPEVTAVYVPTPAATHVDWVRRSLLAGKHVLCEKPFSLRESEARELVTEARSAGLTLMEAHHSFYHPLRSDFLQAVAEIDQIVSVEAVFDAPIGDENDIRVNAKLGAGVFLDFGGYLLSWLGWVAEARGGSGLGAVEIDSASALVRPSEIDRCMSVEARLTLPEGVVRGHLRCSMEPEVEFQARVVVRGLRGEVVFENPLAVDGSFLQTSAGLRIESPSAPSTYRGQLEAFCREVEGGAKARHTGTELVQLQGLQERVYERARLLSRFELSLAH